jgi:glucosamine--fructose-6-phosphate aminotransferase (isomerizing)
MIRRKDSLRITMSSSTDMRRRLMREDAKAMCGITGIVSTRNIGQELFAGMQRLEYRGYDSAGMAVLHAGQLEVRKDAGTIAEVDDRLHFATMQGHVGIAHTRWATHGGVSRVNAHPHVSRDQRFAVVHNGVIDNYLALKAELEAQGSPCRSQTDSEVIVHLIAAYHARGYSVEDALVAATRRLQGAFAFALLTAHAPDTLFCVRHETPLVIGIGPDAAYLASDVHAFAAHTPQVVFLDDGEYAMLRVNDYAVRSLRPNGPGLTRLPVALPALNGSQAEKGAYAHFMLKEIHEGAACVATALALPEAQIAVLAQRLHDSAQVYLTGIGTSYYVALLAQAYFAASAERYIPVISADEFLTLGKVGPGTLTLAISQSGETYDTLKALRYTRAHGGQTAAIVNVPASSMAREVDLALLQGAGPEICVLSTKSTISQTAILVRLALELGRQHGQLDPASYQEHMQALTRLPAILQAMYSALLPQVQRIAQTYCHTPNWFFIGRGIYTAVALESALKFKEVSYLHAEGMSGGFLKHGTIALIDEHTHTMAFLPTADEPALLQATLTNIQEIRARGGLVIAVHAHGTADWRSGLGEEIVVPAVPPLLMPFVHLTAGQMVAYYTAVALGRDIDKPRALAKSVTVA